MSRQLSFPTQESLVLGYMERHAGITQLDAINELGITRLSARIYRIENDRNVKVYRRNLRVKNRFGQYTTVTQYSLKPLTTENKDNE